MLNAPFGGLRQALTYRGKSLLGNLQLLVLPFSTNSSQLLTLEACKKCGMEMLQRELLVDATPVSKCLAT